MAALAIVAMFWSDMAMDLRMRVGFYVVEAWRKSLLAGLLGGGGFGLMRSVVAFDMLAHLVRRAEVSCEHQHAAEGQRGVSCRVRMLPHIADERSERSRHIALIHVFQRTLFAPCEVFFWGQHCLPFFGS